MSSSSKVSCRFLGSLGHNLGVGVGGWCISEVVSGVGNGSSSVVVGSNGSSGSNGGGSVVVVDDGGGNGGSVVDQRGVMVSVRVRMGRAGGIRMGDTSKAGSVDGDLSAASSQQSSKDNLKEKKITVCKVCSLISSRKVGLCLWLEVKLVWTKSGLCMQPQTRT